jgi:hypothetical protein
MEPNDPQFSSESDEGTDSTAFSAVALVGFLMSLVGIFSLGYVQTLPVAILGSLFGVYALLFSERFHLSFLSRVLGVLAVIVGVTILSWGLFLRYFHTDYELAQARTVAEKYLDSLSRKDLDAVFYLVGFQFDGDKPPSFVQPETELQRAKKRLREDPAHVEIQNRRSPAKWTFVSIDGESLGTVGYTYKLKYRDDGQTNPPTYFVYARKDAQRYDSKPEVHWYVDNLEVAK